MANVIFAAISVIILCALSLCPNNMALAKPEREVKVSEPQEAKSDQDESELQSDVESLDMIELMNICNESFRIEMAYLQSLNESGSFLDETDKTPKCFMRCMLMSTGVMSEDGELDPERAALVFAGERSGRPMEIRDITAVCAAKRQEKCRCEKAYNFMRCVMSMEIEKYGSAL